MRFEQEKKPESARWLGPLLADVWRFCILTLSANRAPHSRCPSSVREIPRISPFRTWLTMNLAIRPTRCHRRLNRSERALSVIVVAQLTRSDNALSNCADLKGFPSFGRWAYLVGNC